MSLTRAVRAAVTAAVALAGMAWLGTAARAADETAAGRPNIVYILCDDLGYGDVHALNPERGKIATPNMDRLVGEGMRFTDAHSSSAVCTPSRYSILTGRYAWRTHLQSGVLQGNSKPLIAADRVTVASMLKGQGYTTACFGKWHLGLTWAGEGFKGAIVDGPLQHGFDRYFGISASLDMPPFAFIDQDHFTEEPTATKKWIRSGPAAPSFEAVDVVPTLTKKATEYVGAHSGDVNGAARPPFFLYFALTSPHTPIVPTSEWKGKSGLSDYADFVMETDWAVGQVLKAIDDAGIAGNTVVMFASDNGCSPAAKPEQLEAKGHYPSAGFRGYKADIWDGGHRIPFVVRWPGKVKAGSESKQIVCLGDLIATVAEMEGVKVPAGAGEDSVSVLPALLGKDTGPLREAEVHHSIDGCFAIREGKWKLELAYGSGGWAAPREAAAKAQGLPEFQLYDMDTDPAETKNVYKENPEVVKQLTVLLEKYVKDGRSTPGEAEKNDARIELRKTPKAAAASRAAGD